MWVANEISREIVINRDGRKTSESWGRGAKWKASTQRHGQPVSMDIKENQLILSVAANILFG